jgi:hypothetical protein
MQISGSMKRPFVAGAREIQAFAAISPLVLPGSGASIFGIGLATLIRVFRGPIEPE